MREFSVSYPWPRWGWQVAATKAFYSQDFQGSDFKRGSRDSGVRFFVWNVCRQFGKTALGQAIHIKEAIERPGDYGYFAPQYDRSEKVYEEMCLALSDLLSRKHVYAKATKAGWRIRFSHRCTYGGKPSNLYFHSLNNAEHLRGATLRGFTHDEAGLGEGKKVRTILIPMIRQTDGWAVFPGTPPDPEEATDPDFFRNIVVRGESGDPRYWSITRDYTQIPDPRVVADIEADRPHIPLDEFEREYCAKFSQPEAYRLPPFQLWGPGTPFIKQPDGLRIFTGVDLADSESEMGDPAAVTTWGVGHYGTLWVMAGEYCRNPSDVLDTLYLHRSFYGSECVKLQRVAFDKGFRYTIEAASQSRGHLPVDFTDVGGSSKRRRIMQLEPIARAGKLFIHSSLTDLQTEWSEFPDDIKAVGGKRRRMVHHYDLLDSLSPAAEDVVQFTSWSPEKGRSVNTVADIKKALRMKTLGRRVSDYYRP